MRGRQIYHHKSPECVWGMIAVISTRTGSTSDQTESDTEQDTEDNDIPGDETAPGTRCDTHSLDWRQVNSGALTMCVLTICRSQGAEPVRQTQAAPRCIIQGRVYTPPTFTSSSLQLYSLPLATHSTTISLVRWSSPSTDQRIPPPEYILPDTKSEWNIAIGVTADVIV